MRSGQADNGQLWPESGTKTASGDTITAYCDGGSRGNPGPAGYGVFLEGAKGETVGELSEFLGKRTNNFAEYSALLGALDFALKNGHPRLRVVADSELMVKQIKGQYRVNSPELRPLYEEAKRRIAQLDSFRIEHVLRNKNKKADQLANDAMDRGMGRGSSESRVASESRTAQERPAVARRPELPTVQGFVKNGVVHFVEGELPDGIFVKIVPDRQ